MHLRVAFHGFGWNKQAARKDRQMRRKALRLVVVGQRSNLHGRGNNWTLSESEETYYETLGLPLIVRIEIVTTRCIETKLVVECEVEWLVGDRKTITGR
jgi:hypothetical protein